MHANRWPISHVMALKRGENDTMDTSGSANGREAGKEKEAIKPQHKTDNAVGKCKQESVFACEEPLIR